MGTFLKESMGWCVQLDRFITRMFFKAEKSRLHHQLYYLVVRSLAADKRDLARTIQSNIPENIRDHVFPGLERYVFKSSVFLAYHMIQVFLGCEFHLIQQLHRCYSSEEIFRRLESFRNQKRFGMQLETSRYGQSSQRLPRFNSC